MRTKSELHLVYQANQIIGKHEITHHFLVSENGDVHTPDGFYAKTVCQVDEEIFKWSPETLGRIASFALGRDGATDYRNLPFYKFLVVSANLVYLGSCMLRFIAKSVLIETMYEILATERLVRFGKEVARVGDYEPTPKMLEFVKQNRIHDQKPCHDPYHPFKGLPTWYGK